MPNGYGSAMDSEPTDDKSRELVRINLPVNLNAALVMFEALAEHYPGARWVPSDDAGEMWIWLPG